MDKKEEGLEIVAIIPARGGSKGFRNKNIAELCGYPLISWSIKQAINSDLISSTWVSSDNQEILNISSKYGANLIKRPDNLSCDEATSESAWLHGIDHLNSLNIKPDIVVGMQCTSPIRDSKDLDNAISMFVKDKYDSLLSVTELEDNFIWGKNDESSIYPINHKINERKPRQKIKKSYLENGSFYLFKPSLIKTFQNRLAGKVGMYLMAKHKSFQIDIEEDLKICSGVMKEFGIN